MHIATLAYPIRGSGVLLGFKKRGLGAGKWNGFGGHVEQGEEVHDAAIRELVEECGLIAGHVDAVGTLGFPQNDLRVFVFLVRTWHGKTVETDEMEPRWFNVSKIPFDRMWPDDRHWLPYALAGWTVNGTFTFGDEDLTKVELTMSKGG